MGCMQIVWLVQQKQTGMFPSADLESRICAHLFGQVMEEQVEQGLPSCCAKSSNNQASSL